MNNTGLIKIAKEWFSAFNTHDLERLLSLYHDDALHYSPKLKIRQPETNGLIRGKKALREWWSYSFKRFPSLHYEIIRFTPYEDRIFVEYVRRVAGEDDIQVGEFLEFENELITSSRVYHS